MLNKFSDYLEYVYHAPLETSKYISVNEITDSYLGLIPRQASIFASKKEYLGTRDDDVITGSTENDFIIGFGGNDLMFGGSGNDVLMGRKGNDHLIGDFLPSSRDFDDFGRLLQSAATAKNDVLIGGSGDDVLVDQYGSDVLRGGAGNDRLISISDSGTPQENQRIQAQVDDGSDLDKLRFAKRFFNPEGYASNDRLTGGEGADTFEWNLLINATKSIVADNTSDQIINWGMNGVAGENENYHDHWVDGIGRDVITDFSGEGGEGDKIVIKGHTVKAMLLRESESKAVIGLYSDQGNDGERGGGAHDFDVLGKIIVRHDGNFSYENDVSVLGVDYGAYGNGSGLLDAFGFI